MVRISVNGQFLDLKSETKMQFVKSNILFDFDNVQAERTTQFSIPATPKNMQVFGYANKTQLFGESMRRRMSATLFVDGVVQIGYLYINRFSKNSFEAIFVTGDLLGLYNLAKLGKADEIGLQTNAYAYYGVRSTGGGISVPNMGTYAYNSWDNTERPFYRLSYVLDLIMQKQTSVTLSSVPKDNEVVVLTDPKPLQPLSLTITQEVLDSSQPNTDPQTLYNSISVNNEAAALFTTKDDPYNGEPTYLLGFQMYFYPQFLECLQDIKVTFPQDWDADWFLYGMRGQYGEMVFYGDRYFDDKGNVGGTPLAGRTITLSKGDSFVTVDVNDWSYYAGTPRSQGFRQMITINEISGLIIEAANNDLANGDVVYLRDNLPSLTAIDICKIFAALSGKLLYYENGVISFDDFDLSTFEEKNLRDIISIENLERKFGGYAQQNIIDYESGESVPVSQRLQIIYTLDNENIEQNKTLLTIPFSEGGSGVLIGENDNDTIAYGNTVVARLFRTSLTKNENLQEVIRESSSVICRSKMTLLEFQKIHPKTKLYLDGNWWVWTQAKWSDNVAEFNLSKI